MALMIESMTLPEELYRILTDEDESWLVRKRAARDLRAWLDAGGDPKAIGRNLDHVEKWIRSALED